MTRNVDIENDHINISAQSSPHVIVETPDLTETLARAVDEIDEFLKSHPPDRIFSAIRELQIDDNYHTLAAALIVHLKSRAINLDLTQSLLDCDEDDFRGYSHVPFPLGFRSHEDSALLGHEGFIFLVAGSNNVIIQYSPSCTDADNLGDRWAKLTATRVEAARCRDIVYRQILVPEKISILPELFPQRVSVPTRLLARLEEQLKTDGLGWAHLSGFEILQGKDDRRKYCKRFDSHLAPLASFRMFQHIVKSVTNQAVADLPFDGIINCIGDLGFRMFGAFLPEPIAVVKPESLPEFCASASKFFENMPAGGGFRGRRQIWENPNAPIKKKIVVFGNSYFSFVENGQSGLSWWCSKWFQEYHFVWTNEVEWDYVDEIDADIVIWQGVERFLPLMPAS